MIEKNERNAAKKYFMKALEFIKITLQKIFILFLICRLYDLKGDDTKAWDIWHYHKLVVTLGALIGLILACLMSKVEPSPRVTFQED